jgi:hypothetical protein
MPLPGESREAGNVQLQITANKQDTGTIIKFTASNSVLVHCTSCRSCTSALLLLPTALHTPECPVSMSCS